MFVLDGWDELRPEFLWKNLYESNNLEQYRPLVSEGGGQGQLPKLIVFGREEQLTTVTNYQRYFFPFESENPDKDDEVEVKKFFAEIRMAPFGNAGKSRVEKLVTVDARLTNRSHADEDDYERRQQGDAYIRRHVALKVSPCIQSCSVAFLV